MAVSSEQVQVHSSQTYMLLSFTFEKVTFKRTDCNLAILSFIIQRKNLKIIYDLNNVIRLVLISGIFFVSLLVNSLLRRGTTQFLLVIWGVTLTLNGLTGPVPVDTAEKIKFNEGPFSVEVLWFEVF